MLPHQHVAELMSQREGTQGAHGINEERMRPIKGIDIPGSIGRSCPTRRLHRTGYFQCQFIEIPFPLLITNFSLSDEAPKISICGDVVKAMIVNTHMRNVSGHSLDRALAAQFEKALLSCRIELKQRRTKLKAFGPLSPPARGVFAFFGEHWCAAAAIPCFFQVQDLSSGQFEQPLAFWAQPLRS